MRVPTVGRREEKTSAVVHRSRKSHPLLLTAGFSPSSRQPADSPSIEMLSEIGSDDEQFSDTGDNSDRQNTAGGSGGQGKKGNEDDAEDGDNNGEDDQDDQEDEDASNWSVDRVAKWLVDVLSSEFADVVQIFKTQRIDGSVLLCLTEDDINSMGVTLLGPRRKITKAIELLQQRPGKQPMKSSKAKKRKQKVAAPRSQSPKRAKKRADSKPTNDDLDRIVECTKLAAMLFYVQDAEVVVDDIQYDVMSHTQDVRYFLQYDELILNEYPKLCNRWFKKIEVQKNFHGQAEDAMLTGPEDEPENFVSVAKSAFVKLVKQGGVRVGNVAVSSLKQFMQSHMDCEQDVADRVCSAVDEFFKARKTSSQSKKKKRLSNGKQRCVLPCVYTFTNMR